MTSCERVLRDEYKRVCDKLCSFEILGDNIEQITRYRHEKNALERVIKLI